MGGTKGLKLYKYIFEECHYKGIGVLQEYYGKRLSSSNSQDNITKLSFLTEIKKKQFYTTIEKIRLNDMRNEYLLSKNLPKNDT